MKSFPIVTNVSSSTAALVVPLEPDLYLDKYPVALSELTTAIVSSKPSTSILDPIPLAVQGGFPLYRHFHIRFDQSVFVDRISTSDF